MRHNNVRDFEANLLKTALNDVEIEPKQQKIDNEGLNSLTGDDARPDIRAHGVWTQGQNAFIDIRLANANARSQKDLPVSTILKKHKKEKERAYNSRIMNVEHGTFTALFLSLAGGEDPETFMFDKHIPQKIAIKTDEKYQKVQTLIRCKLSFLILRSVLLCISGSRSISKDSVILDDVSLTCSQACFNLDIGISLFGVSHFESQVPVLILSKLILPLCTGFFSTIFVNDFQRFFSTIFFQRCFFNELDFSSTVFVLANCRF